MPSFSSVPDLDVIASIKESVKAELTSEDWIGVLHLSTTWGFSEVSDSKTQDICAQASLKDTQNCN